jgi:lauroyl/myristoyl acyltransferase
MQLEYRSERSLPANFIYVGKFLRPVFQALARNEVVIDSFDGFMGARKEDVPFLGKHVALAKGPIAIAYRTEAPLIPAFAVRQKDDHHRIEFHPPIPIHECPDEESAIEVATQRYAKLLEHYVTRYPSHYGRILYDRFRDPTR